MTSPFRSDVLHSEGFKILKEGFAKSVPAIEPRLYLEANIVVFRAYVSGVHSDCKVICGPHEFKLHRIILMAQSGYFMSAFKKDSFKV
jgi:hypothetical protein